MVNNSNNKFQVLHKNSSKKLQGINIIIDICKGQMKKRKY